MAINVFNNTSAINTMSIDNKVGKKFLGMLLSLGNSSVGQVTVWHMPFTDILLRLNAGDENDARRKFSAIFGPERGNGAYESVETHMSDVGIEYADIYVDDMAKESARQIVNMEYSAENLRKVCEDMIMYGRAFQEKTIDAVKNFYDVKIPYRDNLRQIGLLSRADEPEIKMAWTENDVRAVKEAFEKEKAEYGRFCYSFSDLGEKGGFFRSGIEHITHKKIVGNGDSARVKVFIADAWHKLQGNCVRLSGLYAGKAMKYTPSLSRKMMGYAEALILGDANFASMAYICLFYKQNLFRSLTSLQARALSNARKLFKREQLREQERAIKARFRAGFAEIGNCLRQYADELGISSNKLALAAIWASFHTYSDKKELVLVDDRVASSFADTVLPGEFSGLMYSSMLKAGEKIATEAVMPLSTCLLEDGDKVEFIENEAWSCDGETLLAEMEGEESVPDGEYIIRWSEDGKRAYAAMPITEKVFSDDKANSSHFAFMLSFYEGKYSYEQFTQAVSKGKEISLIPYKKGMGEKNMVVVDGKVMATYRAFNFPYSNIIPSSKEYAEHKKNVQATLTKAENNICKSKTGTVAGLFSGIVGKGRSVVVLMDNVRDVSGDEIEISVPEKKDVAKGTKLDFSGFKTTLGNISRV